MTKTRLEAFSDAVIAIALTIMVLEMKTPHGADWSDLRPILPTFLSYVMSYVYLGIYWNNHHHMLHVTQRINGHVLWANLHLLFWLSLIPFITSWMSDNDFAPLPTAVYGVVLLAAAIAYTILQTSITRQTENTKLREAVGRDIKGKLSISLYVLAIVLAGWEQWASIGIYVLVALLWLIPDRRIETKVI